MINKVSKKECLDAIDYLWGGGFSQEMGTDKRHYTEILLRKVANDYKIALIEAKALTINRKRLI